MANPLASPTAKPSTNIGFKGPLLSDFKQLFKEQRGKNSGSKARRKLRRLQDAGEVTFSRLTSPGDMANAVDVFLEQKSERFCRLNHPNAFDVPMSREFLQYLVENSRGKGEAALELYTLAIDGDIYAIYGGSAYRDRYTVYFSSIKEGDLSKYTPGELLLNYLVEICCKRGLTAIDLGVGEAAYKSTWCKEPEPLVDQFIPITPSGRLIVSALELAEVAKRQIKKSPQLLATANWMRRLLRD